GSTQAVFAFDTVKFGRKFQVSGGLRGERFKVDGINTAGAPIGQTDTMLSGRAGAVYSPRNNGTVYVSYGSSLNPSLEGLSYGAVTNATVDPEKTYTVEAGTKWDFFQ